MGGPPGRVIMGVGSLGASELLRTKPFQPGGKIGDNIATDFVKISTGGLYDPERGRINVPFSGAQMRTLGKGTANMHTAGQFRGNINEELDRPNVRLGASALGTVAALATGAYLGQAGSGVSVAEGAKTTGEIGMTAGELATAGTTAATPGTTAALAAAPAAAAPSAAGGITAGQALLGSTALTAASTSYSAMTNKVPKFPSAIDPTAIDQAALDAANAVQTANAEARRKRSSKRQSSVLSNFQGATQIGVSPATLQPAAPRKSVLG